MKIKAFPLILSLFILTSCSETTEEVSTPLEPVENTVTEPLVEEPLASDDNFIDPDSSVDYDLTVMSSTMVFSQIYDLVMNPLSYEKSTVKMDGEYLYYDIEGVSERIHIIIIYDATGCCPQGLEIRFPEDVTPPDDVCNLVLKGEILTETDGEAVYAHILVSEYEITD